MYKLLIVEDDAVIRTSLSSIIDWEKYGISLVQSAENGKVAYSTILSQRVDIVLCDVKMPYVTGIELLEMVSKLPVLPLFYMLSAYEDFSLVRKAFTLGAQDYISKSELNENRFVLFAEEVIKKLEERSILPEVLNNTEDICSPFINLKNDVLNKRSIEKNYDIPLPGCLAYIVVENPKEVFKRFGNNFQKDFVIPFTATISQVASLKRKYFLIMEDNFHYWLYYNNGISTSVNSFESSIKRLQNTVSSFMNLGVSSIISDRFASVNQLAKEIKNIHLRENLFLFYPSKQLIHSNDSIPDLVNIEYITKELRLGSSYLESLKPLFDSIVNDNFHSAKKRVKSISYSILVSFSLLDNDLRSLLYPSFYTNLIDSIEKCSNSVDLSFWLQGFLKHVSLALNVLSTDANTKMEDKACLFIREHYNDPSISLCAVADYLELNEKYFSCWFKKKIGVTFLVYLTRIRMEEAQKLIKNTNLKIYEISNALGFTSVNSFSRTYRKYYGHSPKNN
jgi:YesN/AraC family two-component response regulator